MNSLTVALAALGFPEYASSARPSQFISSIGADNFMNALLGQNGGHHDPIEINKYSRLSTQIRQYVAHDIFDHFRGLGNDNNGCHDERMGCTAFAGLEQIWGYGCHCYFGPDWKKSRGMPINEVDGLCQDLNVCYRCIVMDGEADGEVCNPAYQNYTIPTRKDMGVKGITHACFEANAGNACAQRTCCCDTQLTDGIINFFFAGIAFDNQYQHWRGWDPAVNCASKGPNPCQGDHCPKQTLECCGDYPNRFFYKTGHQHRNQCCRQTVYNSHREQCCDGNVLGIHEPC